MVSLNRPGQIRCKIGASPEKIIYEQHLGVSVGILLQRHGAAVMDGINFIQDLAIVLLGAGIAGAFCKRIGLSVIVGYILAGIFVGPFTPPFSLILDVGRIETLSLVGLVFLMFGIGLGLSLTKLHKMGLPMLLATGLGAFFVLNLTHLLGKVLGWNSAQSLFMAAMFMVSSSAVISKVVRELNLGHERSGQLAQGITVLEDIVAVMMLAVLGSQVTSFGAESLNIGNLLTNMGAFVVLLVMAGLSLVPFLLRRLNVKADPELQTIVVAGILFLMALMAVKAGYSLALGAFLLGTIVAEMPQKSGVEKAFGGMRDMFSSVFFVSIGMMIDVNLMFGVWHWIVALTIFIMVIRSLSTGLALMVLGTPPRDARRAGLLLMPLGEFTFVIAQLGVGAHVLPPEYYPITVGISILTVLLTPVINRHAEPLLRGIERMEPRWLSRTLEVYHLWLAQLGNMQAGQLWWQLSKKTVLQVALEILFITGLLAFSEKILAALQESPLAGGLTPAMLGLLFWPAIGILVLVPLIAIWRQLGTLAMIFARLATARIRLPELLIANGIKTICAVGLAYWLFQILPIESLSRWWWLVIMAVLTIFLIVFSRRLSHWHSRWQSSLQDVFAETHTPESSHLRLWMEDSGGWILRVQEFIVPERAVCSGHSIAELRVRSRFGASIVEIDRQGHMIIAPRPTQAIYTGDRLLLLGTQEQIDAARSGLGQVKGPEEVSDFDQAHLERVVVSAGPCVGRSLAELQIQQQTGVLVVGIDRAGHKVINPAGRERLTEEAELLVLGTPERIRQFRRLLEHEQGS
ncbi:MAG: cation:proton antiporter domain-containing protein [Desulfobulbia bacterium]